MWCRQLERENKVRCFSNYVIVSLQQQVDQTLHCLPLPGVNSAGGGGGLPPSSRSCHQETLLLGEWVLPMVQLGEGSIPCGLGAPPMILNTLMSSGGTPMVWWGSPLVRWVVPPRSMISRSPLWTDTRSENNTFPHTTVVGGKKVFWKAKWLVITG